MIFNLNEQKVLSDPSGSSVFKGEKDFNDIVVNLPDNIDGHAATELNYVMHFVDSDGGYSTKILNVDSSGETLKATATVSTSITSKAQAFYAYVLMTDDEETVIGKTNGVIVMIHPVPSEESEIIPPADADKIIKGLEEIVKDATETIDEATDTIEEATAAIQNKQDKLTAGENITITEENVISASSGSNDYTDLTNKPSINNVTLSGNKSSDELNLQGKLTAGANISIADGVISATISRNYFYNEQPDRLSYDFNFISLADQQKTGMWRIRNDATLQNLPSALESIRGRYFYVFNYPNAPYSTDSANYSIRKIIASTASGDFKEYAQIYSANKSGNVISQTDWVELTGGGSQIVSGVVNANGTITFTDSDGNTFTTTGSSVIGADGFSPVATVTQTASGATVSITDSTGTTTANISNGQDGNDYILTTQDKDDIADKVLSELPTTQGVLYGD